MTTPYTPPANGLTAFNCPLCGAFAKQSWFPAAEYRSGQGILIKNYQVVHCGHCLKYTVWVKDKMVYPFSGTAPLPNPDMPDDVKQDYEEARDILSISPRGAAALLRLSIQKLCKHLGQPGENINSDIAALVKEGLSTKLQQALDSVRVIGNNAVHPGQIDLKDDIETANKLFVFVNIICDNQISQPKQIGEFYDTKVPENLRQAIEKRDGK
jgi:endogenous inhibitor of DNA gyrase (YacG/DUF329 family)